MNHNGGSDSASASSSGRDRSGPGPSNAEFNKNGKVTELPLPQRTSPLKMMVALTEKTKVVDSLGLDDSCRRESFQRLVRRYVDSFWGSLTKWERRS